MEDDESAQLVADCVQREARLTAWEHDFITTCQTWLEAKRPLTQPMRSKLDEVWERVTAKG